MEKTSLPLDYRVHNHPPLLRPCDFLLPLPRLHLWGEGAGGLTWSCFAQNKSELLLFNSTWFDLLQSAEKPIIRVQKTNLFLRFQAGTRTLPRTGLEATGFHAFYPLLENLSETEFRSDGLICVAEEISRQSVIRTVSRQLPTVSGCLVVTTSALGPQWKLALSGTARHRQCSVWWEKEWVWSWRAGCCLASSCGCWRH